MTDNRTGRAESDVPSMLDLIRMSPRPIFPPGGRDLYRQIAILTEMAPGKEVLVASCGIGVTAEFFVREFGVQGSGVDEDATLIERGEDRTRVDGIQERLQFQQASMDDLPYRDGVFDVTLGELGLTAHATPEDAIRELVRVTRPGGRVVLVQPVWKAPVDDERQQVLTEHLGARPLMMVEVKQILRASGIRKLHTEAWSDEETAFRKGARKPFPDFAELFTLYEKIGILRRAWKRWGWRGVRAAIAREQRVHRLLTRERVLGLDMVSGLRTEPEALEPDPPEPEAEADAEAAGAPEGSAPSNAADPSSASEDPNDVDTPTPPQSTGS
ncbi:MAG: class I SAM-dependent methyltransferase [Gemmatimonadales bacterium]|nr:MAG: class I SAM-dependent methyltransferase [Gemmatimonadales bacterium]